jgi:hypothetical protein
VGDGRSVISRDRLFGLLLRLSTLTTTPPSPTTMDDDASNEAPLISTLPDDAASPPHHIQRSANKLRLKLVVKDKQSPGPSTSTIPAVRKPDDDEGFDEDDQEDQLIDDYDDVPKKSLPPIIIPPKGQPEPKKRKLSTKERKPRKEKKPPEEGRLKEKVSVQPGAPNLAPPTISWFNAKPNAENREDVGNQVVIDSGTISANLPLPEPPSEKPAGKKKAATKKTPSAPRQKKTPAKYVHPTYSSCRIHYLTTSLRGKVATTAVPVAVHPNRAPMDDAMSEGMFLPIVYSVVSVVSFLAFTGTAASSPVTTAHAGPGSPEQDQLDLSGPPVPPVDEIPINLEGIGPIPVYPLPTKPFPVQTPIKILTGFAPAMPLDKSGKKVRHWRIANREIRGIAGGRWFARSWVGDKESEYATAAGTAKAADSGNGLLAIPKLPTVSISAPVGTKGKGKAAGKASASVSASVSAAVSRSSSVVPEPSAVKVPTKMRTVIVPESDTDEPVPTSDPVIATEL